ncbi:MAG TPA: hypothetical protein VMW24_11475, partial [Sedimentisphaerales bacterium]|nr:hypothetical protein [Sedimentisphaerales bacterium]
MKNLYGFKIVVQALAFSASLLTCQHCAAQGTLSDYKRALSLSEVTADKVFRQRVTPHWFADNTKFWYRNDLADGAREFVLVNAETGVRAPAFDHVRLAAALAKATGEDVRADRLEIDKLEFSESVSELVFSGRGKRWKCDLSNYEIQAVSEKEQTTSSLPARAELRPSTQTGEETSITFINRTENGVEVYWIDTEGQRRQYATIPAGGQHRQHTFAGHVWLVAQKDGNKTAVFVATEGPAEAIIDGESLREAADRPRSGRGSRPRRAESPDGKWSALVRD